MEYGGRVKESYYEAETSGKSSLFGLLVESCCEIGKPYGTSIG